MTVRQTQSHVFTDLSIELLIYRILLLSLFEIRRDQQLAPTRRVRLYAYSVVLGYVIVRVYICILLIQSNATLKIFLFSGNLWMYVELFYFAFTTVSFVGIVMNGLWTNTQQIEFYQELYDFDAKLTANFGVSVRRSRTHMVKICTMIAGLVYLVGDFCISSIHFSAAPNFELAYFLTFYIHKILAFASSIHFVNCTQLCRERLTIVGKLLRNKHHTERLDDVLHLFARIRSQILLINRFMGFVVLLTLTHDFTMGTSIMYVMFSYNASIRQYLQLAWWFSHTVIGTILMTLVAEMLNTEV